MAERVLTLASRPSSRTPAARNDAAGSIRELDRVEILGHVESDEGELIPSGSTGTVVAVWAGGEAYEVEFTEPIDALATVRAGLLSVVARAAD